MPKKQGYKTKGSTKSNPISVAQPTMRSKSPRPMPRPKLSSGPSTRAKVGPKNKAKAAPTPKTKTTAAKPTVKPKAKTTTKAKSGGFFSKLKGGHKRGSMTRQERLAKTSARNK